jgi:tetratricopeptide (TPR) repeat protein
MQTGKSITQRDDRLEMIDLQSLYQSIKEPDEKICLMISRLRLIKTIDAKQYSVLKRQLPYIVCGVFSPPYRKIENFGYCEYFMMDIDHISDKELDIAQLKAKISADSRVVMCFISPGEDGLKALFRLSEKCYDSGQYSLFYKCFIRAFSAQYGLEQVIDSRTSDVSRACFLSYDAAVYYNPEAIPVEMNDFVDFDNFFELKELEHQFKKDDKGIGIVQPSQKQEDPDDEALAFIKEKLNARKNFARNKPQVYIPEQLDEILDKLLEYIKDAGIAVEEIVNIQYGKKFKLRAGLSRAEVNLFFGKKGFSVVKSPRTGTSKTLNEMATAYIQSFIGEYILLRENIVLGMSAGHSQGSVSDSKLIQQQAEALFFEKNYREAFLLYRTLWSNYSDDCNEWDGWRYAYCAQQLKDYRVALDICRQLYPKYRGFNMLRQVYAWSIYYSEINKEKITDENIFFHAGEGILRLSQQEDTYSPYTLTVFKILNYLNKKANYQSDKILEWTGKLNPDLLDSTPFSLTDKEGKPREIASKKEQYYMLRTRALLEAGRFDDCIGVCDKALAAFDKLHCDNDVWFRWRIGLSYEGLGEFRKSLDLQLELLKRKREWFIQKEIAEQYYRLGDYEKSFGYALDSALNLGDTDKKLNTFIVLADTLDKLGKTEEAQLHRQLIAKIKRKEDVEPDVKALKPLWDLLKYGSRERYIGIVKSLLPNMKAGFVETGNGKSYYFRVSDVKGSRRNITVGMKVTFYMEARFDTKKRRDVMNAVRVEIVN